MPVVEFKKKYLYKLLGFTIDDKTLAEQVSKMGFGVDRSDANSVYMEITANRPDLFDAVGFARTLKNFMHRSKRYSYTIDDNKGPAMQITVGKKIKAMRPFIAGLVAMNAKLDEDDIANLMNFSEKFCDTYGRHRRKASIGMFDFDEVTPPLDYDVVGNESFIALNAKKSESFKSIVESSAKGKDYSELIKGGTDGYPALSDQKGFLALIPIVNSERAKLTTKTRNILFEVEGESEYTVNKTAELFAATFMDLECDVRRIKIIYTRSRSVMTPQLRDSYMSMYVNKAEQQLGVAIGFNNVISLANKMGYEAALVGSKIRFKLPVYRIDILNEQDLIEDLAIAYGYDYIQPIKIFSAQAGGVEAISVFAEKIRETMIGLGFSEMLNSYLTNEKTDSDDMGLEGRRMQVKLKNPKASSVTIMRTWLVPSLLKNLSMSVHDKMPQNVFEVDDVFYIEGGKPIEALHLGIVSADSKNNFNTIKAVFEEINTLYNLGYGVEEHKHKSFIDGRCAKIMKKGEMLGFFGELHPQVLSNFGVEEPTVALDLELYRQS